MRVLLDTHTLIWLILDDDRLSPRAKEAYQTADEAAWSVVSLWETAIKLSLGRKDFQLKSDWMETIVSEMRQSGAKQIGVTTEHCKILSTLPWHHRDPFDRMLIAQAMHEDLAVITADGVFAAYEIPVVW